MLTAVVRPVMIGALGITLLLAGACGGSSAPQASHPGSGVPSPAFAVTGADHGGRPGITVTGVVPVAGSRVWEGLGVIVDYRRENVDGKDPGRGEVDLSRCRLSIDGRLQPARVTVTTMSPAARAVMFTWDEPSPPGRYVLRVILPLYRAGSVTCTWTATRT